MTRHDTAWLVIAGAGLATFVLRAAFLVFAGVVAALPVRVKDALELVAPAALAAVVAPALFAVSSDSERPWAAPVAAAVAAAVMARTGRIGTSLVAGLLLFAGLTVW